MTADLTGLAFREVDVTGTEDLDCAFHIIVECERAAVGWSESTLESVRTQLTRDVRPEHRLLAELDGDPSGVLLVDVNSHGREVFIDAFAVGESTRALLVAEIDRGVRLAREVVSAAHAAADLDRHPWHVRAAAYAQDEEYRSVLAEAGFAPVRRFWRMLLPLAGRSAVEPPPPPGVVHRTVASEDDRRLLHRIFRESFAEHWGTTLNRPTEEWLALLEESAGNDPSRWWLAYLDDEPVGLCILDDYLAEFDEGHVRTLGVIPAARGRGIARWLLECAAADAVARGRTGLALSVDGQNTTGATHLYESAGFRIRQEVDAWELTR